MKNNTNHSIMLSMELTVGKKHLARAVALCSRIATTRGSLPVLGNILLATDGKSLRVSSTNLELASTSIIGAKVIKSGEITIPAKLLAEFVASLPDEPITITSTATKLVMKCAGYTSTFNGIDAEEFPELPTIDETSTANISIDATLFKQSLTQVLFACSHDVTRPVLTGVYWHMVDGSVYVAGTDGYRLAERRIMQSDAEVSAIIPSTTIQEVLRTIQDDTSTVELLIDESQACFRVGEAEITSRLIDGKYPDYRQLIPKSSQTTATLSTSELMRTAKIASLFARDSGGSITLRASDGSLTVRSVQSEAGDNESIVAGDVSGDGVVSINARYLSEVLSVIDHDTVQVNYGEKLSPVLVTPGTKDAEYVHIIMPLKS